MPNKKQTPPPKRTPTRRQLSRYQREKRSRNITLAAGSVVIVIVVALLGLGAYFKYVLPPMQPAYTVNGTTFDMSYYVRIMRWLSGDGRSLQSATPDAIQQTIVDSQLLAKAAPGLGISVTETEALQPMRQQYTSTLPQGQTLDEAKFQTWFDGVVKGYGLSRQDMVSFLEANALVTKLKDYLGKDLPANAPQVHLLGIESTDALGASQVQDKLAQGTDFQSVAQTDSINSDTSSKGGDLGWFVKDLLPTDVANAVFSLPAGGVTQVAFNGKMTANDPGGFWIFKVSEKDENRAVDSSMMDALKSKLAGQWFNDQTAKAKIDNMVTNDKRAWALTQVPAQ